MSLNIIIFKLQEKEQVGELSQAPEQELRGGETELLRWHCEVSGTQTLFVISTPDSDLLILTIRGPGESLETIPETEDREKTSVMDMIIAELKVI